MLQPPVCGSMCFLQVYFPQTSPQSERILIIPLAAERLSPQTRRPFAIQKRHFCPPSDSPCARGRIPCQGRRRLGATGAGERRDQSWFSFWAQSCHGKGTKRRFLPKTAVVCLA